MVRGARFLGPMDRVLYLRSLEEVAGLSSAELAAMAEHAKECYYRAGQTVIEEGELPEAFYLVVDGSLEVNRDGSFIARAGPRQGVGLLSILARDERGIQAVAVEDTVCLRFSADLLMDALEESFAIAQNILGNTARLYVDLFRKVSGGTVVGPWGQETSCPARPLDLVERILLLRRAQVFRHTSLDALAELVRHMTEVRMESATPIWREGEPTGQILFLVCGSVECSMRSIDQSFVATAGFPLGAVETYAGVPRWYDATTLDHVVALKTDSEIMLDLMEDHPDMSLDFLAAVSGRVMKLEERFAEGSA